MAISAFKSTSRRGNLSTGDSTASQSSKQRTENSSSTTKKVPQRRSKSVSAFSRASHLDVDSDFVNTRENPLFWASISPTSDGESAAKLSKFDDVSTRPSSKVLSDGGGGAECRRGRSVTRNCGVGRGSSGVEGGGGMKDVGRSLSRVDPGRRRRSVSRGHYGSYESERELECSLLSKYNSDTKINSNLNRANTKEKGKIARSASDLSEILKGVHTSGVRDPGFRTYDDFAVTASCLHISNSEDEGSTSLVSKAKEKTIRPVKEQKKGRHLRGDDVASSSGIVETVRTEVKRAICDIQNDLKTVMRRNNSPTDAKMNIADISPDLVNPDALELVVDIRGEYAKKLDESQERARKLRAELAVEEHRGLELTKILKEIIPHPKTPHAQKPCVGRKASIERRKMSKRLEEEAMAYFDECVSISTLDGSDFSSLEDPPSHLVRTTDLNHEILNMPEGSSGISTVCHSALNQDSTRPSLFSQINESSGFPVNDSTNESLGSRSGSITQSGLKPQFSFARRSIDASKLEQDIRNHVKSFIKDDGNQSCSSEVGKSSHHDTDIHPLKIPMEKVLFDRMVFKSRIESGGLLICGGGIGYPVASLTSIIR